MTEAPITSFHGEYRFLSNFYASPILLNDILFPTVEHAYQACKTMDKSVKKEISLLDTPGQAKRFGQKIEIREDWDELKMQCMTILTHEKYRIPALRECLLNTGDAELIEGNTWGDTFWGVCNGKGHNHLGHIIMNERDFIRKGAFNDE